MNIKALLKNPLDYTLQHWFQPDNSADNELLELASAVELDREAITHTRSELQLCANQLANNTDEEIQPLLESKFHSIQEQLGHLKHDRRQHVYALLSSFRTRTKQAGLPHLYKAEPSNAPEPITIGIELANKAHRDEWNEYVNGHSKASSYHFFGWKDCADHVDNAKHFYFIARNTKQQVVGILPIVERKNSGKLFGVSLPECDFGGALSNAPDISKRLYWRAGELAKQRKWTHIEYRTNQGDLPWLADKAGTATVTIVPDSRSQLQQLLPKETLTNIDRLSIHNPGLHYGQADLLNNFHAIYTHCCRTRNEQTLPKKFFSTLLESIPNSLLVVGKIRNNPVVAAILVQHDDLLEVRWQANSWPTYSSALNDWLRKEILLHAIETGISYVKFNEDESCANDEANCWPLKSIQTHWHYWLNKGVALDDIIGASQKNVGILRRILGKLSR